MAGGGCFCFCVCVIVICPINTCHSARVEVADQSDVAVHVEGGKADVESAKQERFFERTELLHFLLNPG